MEDKFLTLHPDGKQGVNINKVKYDQIRQAILGSIREHSEIGFKELSGEVERRTVPGNVSSCDQATAWEDAAVSEERIFEEYAAGKKLSCRGCGSRDLKFAAQNVLSLADQTLNVEYRCSACGMTTEITVSARELLDENDT